MRLPYGSLLALAFLATAARGQTEVERLADLLALRSGMTVAEVGAGGGDFAVALAGRVGESGRVYATELEAGKRDEIRAAAERAGLANLEVLEAGISATGLPTSCCDAVLMRHVYHHLTDPAAIDRDLLRALEPGGLLVVVDFPPTWYLRPWTPEGVGEERSRHGIEPDVALAELSSAGFERVRVIEPWIERWLGPDSYALVVRKPEAPALGRAGQSLLGNLRFDQVREQGQRLLPPQGAALGRYHRGQPRLHDLELGSAVHLPE